MTASEIVLEIERYLRRYPKRAGETPLTIVADVNDEYIPVQVKIRQSGTPPLVAFERAGAGDAITAHTAKAILDGVPHNAEVVVVVGSIIYDVYGVAAHNKQAVVLLTKNPSNDEAK